MKRNARRKQWNKVGVLLFVMALLTGCGKTPGPGEAGHYTYYPQEKQEDNTEFVFEGTEDEVYALLSIDYVEEMIHVYRYANGLEYQYYYGMQTNFLDKYGNVTAATNFAPGSLVELGRTDSQGLLQEVRAADSVWVYPDVVRFSVDETKHIFDIAGTEYKYDASIFVFSDDEQIKITDLAEQDKLTVIGKDKQILSIQVTT